MSAHEQRQQADEHAGQKLLAVQFELAVRRFAQQSRERGLRFDTMAARLIAIAEEISPGASQG